MTGAFIVIMTILLVLIGSFCLAILNCCHKRAQPQNVQQSASQSSLATEDSDVEEGVNDFPPRYSLVVVTSHDHQGKRETTFTSKQQILQRLSSDSGSINSVFVLPTPPPNYTQAMMDLAEKGIFFNSEGTGIMPPIYKGVVVVEAADEEDEDGPQPEIV